MPVSPPSLDVACFDTLAGFNTVTFTNTSSSTLPVGYFWDFGDGDSSLEISPVHAYTQPGVYVVTLTATNIFDCSDSYQDTGYDLPSAGGAHPRGYPTGLCPPLGHFADSSLNSGIHNAWVGEWGTLSSPRLWICIHGA